MDACQFRPSEQCSFPGICATRRVERHVLVGREQPIAVRLKARIPLQHLRQVDIPGHKKSDLRSLFLICH